MANISLLVNGKTRLVNVEPQTPLLYVLRNDLELNGPKFGCGMAQCGAYTVLIGGKPQRSCVTPVSGAAVANALANTTGKRFRALPFTPERVLASLKA